MIKTKHIEMLREQMAEARSISGMTQKELAKKINTKQESISRFENKGTSSIATAEKFIKACGLTLTFHHISLTQEDGSQYTSFYG